MATFRIEFTPESGIEPQEQEVEADGFNDKGDAYRFYDQRDGSTIRLVMKEYVRQIVRE